MGAQRFIYLSNRRNVKCKENKCYKRFIVIKKVWFILASSFAVGEAGFTSFRISERKVIRSVGVSVKARDRQYFKGSEPHGFADPAGFIRQFETKLEIIFPKDIYWFGTTARPLEVRGGKF